MCHEHHQRTCTAYAHDLHYTKCCKYKFHTIICPFMFVIDTWVHRLPYRQSTLTRYKHCESHLWVRRESPIYAMVWTFICTNFFILCGKWSTLADIINCSKIYVSWYRCWLQFHTTQFRIEFTLAIEKHQPMNYCNCIERYYSHVTYTFKQYIWHFNIPVFQHSSIAKNNRYKEFQ